MNLASFLFSRTIDVDCIFIKFTILLTSLLFHWIYLKSFFIWKKKTVLDEEVNPCSPSPCGANAICKERNGVGSCLCIAEYFGDPYTGCRPECVQNSECDRSKACVNNKCIDPCPGVCGINASKYLHISLPLIAFDQSEYDNLINCSSFFLS